MREVLEITREVMQTDPDMYRQFSLFRSEFAACRTAMGHAEDEVAIQPELIALDPRSSWLFSRYRHMGRALALLGRESEAITWLEKSIAANPAADATRPYTLRWLAACYARTGQIDLARNYMAAANRIAPYATARGFYPFGGGAYDEQIRRLQAALRLAGERDHADEDADFGLPSDRSLHERVRRTDTEGRAGSDRGPHRRPLAPDRRRQAGRHRCHDVFVGAVDPRCDRAKGGRPRRGKFSDGLQDRLRQKMSTLSSDLDRPIVAVGWNSERFDGRNLALRLVALGYRRVYWYRGGRELWEVAELPEAALDVQDW